MTCLRGEYSGKYSVGDKLSAYKLRHCERERAIFMKLYE